MSAGGSSSIGELTNLCSVDANRSVGRSGGCGRLGVEIALAVDRADHTCHPNTKPPTHTTKTSVEAIGYIHFLWSTLLQILVCVYLIFHVLGPSALAGLAFMVIRWVREFCVVYCATIEHTPNRPPSKCARPTNDTTQPPHHGLGLRTHPAGPDPHDEAQGRAHVHRLGGAAGAVLEVY